MPITPDLVHSVLRAELIHFTKVIFLSLEYECFDLLPHHLFVLLVPVITPRLHESHRKQPVYVLSHFIASASVAWTYPVKHFIAWHDASCFHILRMSENSGVNKSMRISLCSDLNNSISSSAGAGEMWKNNSQDGSTPWILFVTNRWIEFKYLKMIHLCQAHLNVPPEADKFARTRGGIQWILSTSFRIVYFGYSSSMCNFSGNCAIHLQHIAVQLLSG